MKFKEVRMSVNDERLIPLKVEITIEEVNLLGADPDDMKIRLTAQAMNANFPKKVYRFERIGNLMSKFPTVESILSEFESVDKNVALDEKFFKSRLHLIALGEMNGGEELYDLDKYKEAPFVLSTV